MPIGAVAGKSFRMSTVTTILEPEADGTLHLPVPEELKSAKVKVVATLEVALAEATPSPLGMWKGKLELLPGWDEPLEDFKQYME